MSKRVLIIDDDLQTLELLRAAISSLGVDITTAMDGMGALEAAFCMPPDVVIMDMLLPESGMRGWEAVTALKKDAKLGHIPIIAITAGITEYMDKALDAGANDCLQKPFSVKHLQGIIRHYLSA